MSLPQLRSDISATPVATPSGPAHELCAPDGRVLGRISERVYHALLMLDSYEDFGSWAAAVNRRYSDVTGQRLEKLLSALTQSGVLVPRQSDEDDGFDERTIISAHPNPFQPGDVVASFPPHEAVGLRAGIPAAHTIPESEEAFVLPHGPGAAGPPPSAMVEMPSAPAAPMAAEPESEAEGEGEVEDEDEVGTGAAELALAEVAGDGSAVRRRWARRALSFAKVASVPALLVVVMAFIPYPLKLTYECELMPVESETVRAPFDGILEKVYVEEGQRVEAGELLGELAHAELELSVVKSQAALDRVSAELELLKQGSRAEELERVLARVNGLRRELALANSRVTRLRKLVKDGVAPRAELESAEGQRAALSGELAQAQAQYRLLRAGAAPDEIRKKEAELRSIEAQLELDRKMLESSKLVTKRAGMIATKKPKELLRTRITAGDTVFEVMDAEKMRVEVRVSERDFDALALGLPMSVKVAAYPTETFEGEVARVSERVEVTPRGNIIRVEGIIDNSGGKLLANMSGYAEIVGEERSLLSLTMRRAIRWVRVRFFF